ncbi:MAG: hypothetical protein IJF54_05175 [Clostridia bacterium]|nr:hypothetical protein [Clostridia bacterium]
MNFLKKKSVLAIIALVVVAAVVIVAVVLSNRGDNGGVIGGGNKDNEPTYKGVLFITEDGSAYTVMEDGKVLDASAIKNAGIASGSAVEVTLSSQSGLDSVVTSVRTVINQTMGGVRTEKSKAPETFAEFWLDRFLFNGTNAAVSEYKINDVSIIDDKTEGRIDVKVNFDVKPCEGVVIYGEADDKGYVKALERSFSIYGTQGFWTSYESFYNIMAKNIGPSANTASDFFAAGESQRVLYADKNYVYYIEKKETTSGVTESIVAFKVEDKSTSKLLTLPENTNGVYGALTSGKLYINSVNSMGSFAKLYCIDVATAKLTVAHESAMALTATSDTLFFVTEETKLHSMNAASGEVKAVGTTPISLSRTKASISSYIKDNNIYVYVQKDILQSYKISLTDGKTQTVELFK